MTTKRATVTTEQDGALRRCGPAWHRRVGGLHVLGLSGSDYEMGRQHGALLRDEIARGPLAYYSAYLRRVMRLTGLGPLAPLGAAAIDQTVGRVVARSMPASAREAIRGLADGAGLPHGTLLRGACMPDALMWAAAANMRLRKIGPARDHRLALGLGCTSAIAWGEATADGALLHGRNMDYHGVECWPATAAVIFHQPDRGQRYVAISAAGVLLGGITAMNEAGLSLAVHQHMFTDQTTLGGTPIGCVGDVVMREASSLDEAEAILRRYTPIGCWTYLVTDGKTGEVLCYEENPFHRATLRRGPAGGTFGYANIYLDPALGATERDLYGSYWRANMGRQLRAEARLRAGSGTLDPDAMASVMGDDGGRGCRLSRAVAMLMTVSSVVFRPKDGVFWVARGGAPVSNNPYLPFSLQRQGPAPEHGELSGGVPADAAADAAFRAYRDAYVAYFDRGDLAASQALMAAALARQPRQPLYHLLDGLLALKRGRSAAAVEALDRALGLGHEDEERVASFHLWRGRARDLSGDRAAARRDYEAALALRADPPVAAAARRGLARRFSRLGLLTLSIDFSFADVMAP